MLTFILSLVPMGLLLSTFIILENNSANDTHASKPGDANLRHTPPNRRPKG